MKRIFFALTAAAFSLAWALSAGAQVPDHLKCYRIKDPIGKAVYTADLGESFPLAAEAGCVVKVPGKLLCVDTTKTNVSPAPPGAAPGEPAGRFVCYKVKCPKATLPGVPWTDQFGTRTIQPVAPKMLCAPEPAPGQPCVDGGCAACGSCGDGRCHRSGGGGGCGAPGEGPQCVSAATCIETMCGAFGGCDEGQVCVFGGPTGASSLCCDPCP